MKSFQHRFLRSGPLVSLATDRMARLSQNVDRGPEEKDGLLSWINPLPAKPITLLMLF